MGLDQRLREARERAKLTQQALADRIGVTDAYITQLETGAKSNPSLAVLRDLAAALGRIGNTNAPPAARPARPGSGLRGQLQPDTRHCPA